MSNFENSNKGPWGNLGEKKSGSNKPNLGSSGNGSSGGSGNDGGDKIIDFEKFFKKPGGNNGEIILNLRSLITLIVVLITGWFLTGFYKVDASEEGVVLRFGKFHRTAPEGLRYHLPNPIEKVFVVKKTVINSIDVGFRSKASQYQIQNYNTYTKDASSVAGQEISAPSESLMITGDTNIADVSFVVQWRIKNSFDYLFNITNPVDTVKAVAESSMREVIGRSMFAESMTTKRNQIEEEVRNLMQSTLDGYEAGIEIYVVNLNDVQNPSPVMPAFLDVETAKQDMETAINKAKSYENGVIPKARGEARKIIQEAEAYKQEVVSLAEGDAARFKSVYNEYVKSKDVTKKRMYLDTMKAIYENTSKIVIDGKAGNGVVPYLSLDKLKTKKK